MLAMAQRERKSRLALRRLRPAHQRNWKTLFAEHLGDRALRRSGPLPEWARRPSDGLRQGGMGEQECGTCKTPGVETRGETEKGVI